MSRITYDETGDVLYITFKENVNCYAEELGDGIVGRYDFVTNEFVGITIDFFQKRIDRDKKLNRKGVKYEN